MSDPLIWVGSEKDHSLTVTWQRCDGVVERKSKRRRAVVGLKYWELDLTKLGVEGVAFHLTFPNPERAALVLARTQTCAH